MDPSPFLAEHMNRFVERIANSDKSFSRKSVILSNSDWPVWAVQIEDRLMSAAENMHVRRNVVGRIDHDAESVEPQDSRHAER
jgi:hypothetical protein